MVVAGVKLEHTDFDIPVEINTGVEGWVRYFTGRGRKVSRATSSARSSSSPTSSR